jgi:hypothetical protein
MWSRPAPPAILSLWSVPPLVMSVFFVPFGRFTVLSISPTTVLSLRGARWGRLVHDALLALGFALRGYRLILGIVGIAAVGRDPLVTARRKRRFRIVVPRRDDVSAVISGVGVTDREGP